MDQTIIKERTIKTEKDHGKETKKEIFLKEKRNIQRFYMNSRLREEIKFPKTKSRIFIDYSENRADFYIDKDEIGLFLKFYWDMMYFGEWGDFWERPIIFMIVKTNAKTYASKKTISPKTLLNINNSGDIKLSIYFELWVENPKHQNDKGMCWTYIGGLNNLLDPSLSIVWEDNNLEEDEIANWPKISTYEYREMAKETGITLAEMKAAKQNWKLFSKEE